MSHFHPALADSALGSNVARCGRKNDLLLSGSVAGIDRLAALSAVRSCRELA
ncbi:MAG: hypothetical protein ACLR9W_09685 [Enterobacter hormaechei]